MQDGEYREYVFQTYAHVSKRINDLAAGLSSLSLPPTSNIGIFSVNRAEWLITEQACYANRFVTVPLYDTLGDEAIEHIVNQTEMECAVVSLQKVLRCGMSFCYSRLMIVAAVVQVEGKVADVKDDCLHGL